jgi:NADPH-ferrihemoprotein reductase
MLPTSSYLVRQNKEIVVFWGSQSGTAERFAHRLAKECKSRFGANAIAVDIFDYDPESISNIHNSKLAIFIISTYGDGDPSDNASQFLGWLGGNKTITLPNLRYAAFGLGNSKYRHYNEAVDVLTASLDQLHATRVFNTGKADDSNGGTEDDFTKWKRELFSTFTSNLGYTEVPNYYVPMFKIVEDDSLTAADLVAGEPTMPRAAGRAGLPTSTIYPIPITRMTKLYSSMERSCIHVEVDLSGHNELKYTTGDHLAIWPSNPTSEVDSLLSVLGRQKQKDVPLLITSLDPSGPNNNPLPVTLEVLFRYYIEICHPVSRETISNLVPFAPSPTAAALLSQIGQDKSAFQAYCARDQNTLANILKKVVASGQSWSELPLSFVLEILPRLVPRYYSISSSSIVQPRCVAITVATSTTNENGEPIPGVATNYLRDVEGWVNSSSQTPNYALSGPNDVLVGNRVFAHIRKSKFRLPALAKRPIIMIASGSGIAPFRGFLYERMRLAAIGKDVGSSKLFFGCRNPEELLYQEELHEIGSRGSIEIVAAFSRMGPKQYVQDVVEKRQDELTGLLIESNAYLYICGSAKMARAVTERLGACLMMRMQWNDQELRDWSDQMKRDRKWQEDVWR